MLLPVPRLRLRSLLDEERRDLALASLLWLGTGLALLAILGVPEAAALLPRVVPPGLAALAAAECGILP